MNHPDEIDSLLGIESAYTETVQRHYHERIAGMHLAARIREIIDGNANTSTIPARRILDSMRMALAEYEHLSHGFSWAANHASLNHCPCTEQTLPMWRGRCVGCGVYIWTHTERAIRTELAQGAQTDAI